MNWLIGFGVVVAGIYVYFRWGRRPAQSFGRALDAGSARAANTIDEEHAVRVFGTMVESEGARVAQNDDVIAKLQVEVRDTTSQLASARTRLTGIQRLMAEEMVKHENAEEIAALDKTTPEAVRIAAKAEWTSLNGQLEAQTLRVEQLDNLLTEMQLELAQAENELNGDIANLQRAKTVSARLAVSEEMAKRRTDLEASRSALRPEGGIQLERWEQLATKRVDVLREKATRRKTLRNRLTGDSIEQRLAALSSGDAFASALATHRGGTADGAAVMAGTEATDETAS